MKALEHHSESTESLYVQIPGLKVVVPSTPLEAKIEPEPVSARVSPEPIVVAPV